MKRTTLVIAGLLIVLFVQGQEKPNINKGLKLLTEGKLSEAKQILDAATTYEKTMNEGKTWYYRGLLYATLDTTSKAEFKTLAPEPLKTAMESFAKADQLGTPGKDYYLMVPNAMPVTKTQQMKELSNYYLRTGAGFYEKDEYEDALKNFEKVIVMDPKDTLGVFYSAIVANNLEQHDKALEYFNAYIEKGGTSKDVYFSMYQIYTGPKDDKNKALEVIQRGKAKFPENKDFIKVELGLLIDLDKVDAAKAGLETAIKNDPTNKLYHFFLGYINSRLEKWDDSKKNFEEALRIDPNYADAQYYLAQIYYIDAEKIKKEMNDLGISPADKKKKIELDAILVKKYRTALPFWEKARTMDTSNVDILDKLSIMYYSLGEDAKAEQVDKLLKQLEGQ